MSTKNLLLFLAAVIVFEIGRYFYFKPKYVSGDDTMSFTATLFNGEKFELSSLRGNYVLLDFWGSWCGSCRKENPLLSALYYKYNDKKFNDASNFEIVSIGIEKSKDNWVNAIKKDGLNWKYHILQDQNFDSEIPRLFGVKEIPTKYLLDTEGKVIMTNPSAEEIDKFLKGKLGS
jgi:thiol-disulfide isomerase/thioredoxin